MSRRRRAPVLETLESRELLMGFSMNPIRTPVVLNLGGTAQGSPSAGQMVVVVNASGVITPVGPASVSGRLYSFGTLEYGTLTLNSRSSRLTLSVSGYPGKPLHFTVVGTTDVPHSAFDFRAVNGRGYVTLQYGPGPKGPLVSLKFTG